MPLEYRIDQIICKAGTTPDSESEPLTIDVGTVTILVGANNSGKSQFLKDIESHLPNSSSPKYLVETINMCSAETVDDVLDLLKSAGSVFNKTDSSYVIVVPSLINPSGVEITDKIRHYNLEGATNQLAKAFCVLLDGTNRFNLISERNMGDLLGPPRNHLTKLLLDDNLRKKTRTEIAKAFKNSYFVIDPTKGGRLRVRFSKIPPPSNILERSFGNDAIEFFQNTNPIENTSDGIKAYTGLCLAIVAGMEKIMLIDEPEAFLHPPLAKQLGNSLASLAKDANKQIITATHSAEFLLGCIESGIDVNVVRLTYDRDTEDATARKLGKERIDELMVDPLLRSAEALKSIFYDGVIVVEGYSDRAIYGEIFYRLQEYIKIPPNLDIQFINAMNKQTLHRLAKPLRELGIPAAIIADLDVIFVNQSKSAKKSVWQKILDGAFIPEDNIRELENYRVKVNTAFNSLTSKNRNIIKRQGIDALPSQDKAYAKHLVSELAEYGVFIVPCGELESWFSKQNISSDSKTGFVIKVFEYLGKRGSDEYVKPLDNGIWHFIKQVTEWINNPQRKGIPNNQ